jgi:trehalose/maltose hydrolase-like predicted phosphorylase
VGRSAARVLDRTFAAIVCDWATCLVGAGGEVEPSVGSALDALTAFAVEVIVASDLDDATDWGRGRARPGPGELHVCRYREHALAEHGWLWQHLTGLGIGPGLVLVAGIPRSRLSRADPSKPDERWGRTTVLAGGPERFLAILEDQVGRHRAGRVPDIDVDPGWVITVDTRDPRRLRADESVLTLADGCVGTRGSVEEGGSDAAPGVYCADLYTGVGSGQRLLLGPQWTVVAPTTPAGCGDRRFLDLRTGTLLRDRTTADGSRYRSARFAFPERPGVVAMRVESGRPVQADTVLLAPDEPDVREGRRGDLRWMQVRAHPCGGVTAAAQQARGGDASVSTLERLAAFVPDRRRAPPVAAARAELERARDVGLPGLLREGRRRWAGRWADCDIEIGDDLELQRAVRLALFHLQSSVAVAPEVAVGARGLSGPGYAGHVFWDADVFVLPAMTAIAPAAARGMLEYRLRRLDAARSYAALSDRRGVRFPWESARDGSDVTPRTAILGGRPVPVLTGDEQEHIVADVAWAAWHYASWTGDEAFLATAGYPLLVETARYWASRVRRDDQGQAHIDRVIGPDEYHVGVNDNAFTNVMARWNLRRAAELARRAGPASDAEEAADWCAVADALVDGYDPRTKVYEQFAGYADLEPLRVGDLGRPPLAADLLLGPDRVANSQIIKQPDVLMLHHLVPDEVAPGSLIANLDFYGPRTAHGSSLSPAIHAGLAARAGRTKEALDYLREAAMLDLADITGVTASGLHLATMGGLWQAIAFGFLGMSCHGGVLGLEPRLPPQWSQFAMRCRVRSVRLSITLSGDRLEVEGDAPLRMSVAGAPATMTRTLSVPRWVEGP